jgi:hypothetical protein
MGKKRGTIDRDRLIASLAASLPEADPGSGPGPGGGYQMTAAFSDPERRRFLGAWAIAEHRVEGQPYLDNFVATTLRGASLLEGVYASTYEFRESICVKRVMIGGLLELPEGRVEYSYRMSVAISWELGPGFLLVRPELGYQTSSLAGKPAAVKELSSPSADLRINYRFEGKQLLLEEGGDFKRLSREAT